MCKSHACGEQPVSPGMHGHGTCARRWCSSSLPGGRQADNRGARQHEVAFRSSRWDEEVCYIQRVASVVRLHGAGSPAPSGSIRLQGRWRRTAPDAGAGRLLAPDVHNDSNFLCICCDLFPGQLAEPGAGLEPDRSRTQALDVRLQGASSVAPVRLQLSQQVHMLRASCQ